MTTAINAISNENTKAFAIACYDSNDLGDLKEMSNAGVADETDMKQWNLCASQWQEAVDAAIADLEADSE